MSVGSVSFSFLFVLTLSKMRVDGCVKKEYSVSAEVYPNDEYRLLRNSGPWELKSQGESTTSTTTATDESYAKRLISKFNENSKN